MSMTSSQILSINEIYWIFISRGLPSAAFGITTAKTPLVNSALIFLVSTDFLKLKVLLNDPNLLSTLKYF